MVTKMAGRLVVQDGAQIAARCILWSDEAVFHTGGFFNRHNCHYLAAHDPEVTVKKMQNRPEVTVWCGMTATRVIGAYLLRDTMPKAIFRCWTITCGLSYLAGKTSMNLFSFTMAHRHTLH